MLKQSILIVCVALIIGCDNAGQNNATVSSSQAVERHYDKQKLVLGEKVYRQHCASCHGQQAEGDPNWRQRGPDGMFPPPALNGSAHAWHHPVSFLKQMIAKGSPQGKGNMPAWEDKLTDEEMDAVIDWFQSLWPDQIYAAWYEAQQRR